VETTFRLNVFDTVMRIDETVWFAFTKY